MDRFTTSVNDPHIDQARVRGECNPGYTQFQDRCYQVFNDLLTQTEATTSCVDIVAILASAATNEIQTFLSALVGKDPTGDLWIGLIGTDEDGDGTYDYVWQNGDTFDGAETRWATDPPASEACVVMGVDFFEPGLWESIQCDSVRRYICELPASGVPQPFPACTFQGGWSDYEEYLRYCFRVNPDLLPFADALAACETDNLMSLASIQSGFYANEIMMLMNAASVDSAWIGLSLNVQTTTFLWSDTSTFALYHRWGRLEPSSTSEDNGCVSIDAATGDWTTGPCSDAKPSICSVLEVAPEIPPGRIGGVCPDGWEDDGETTCYYNVSSPMTLADAQSYCTSLYPTSSIARPRNAFQNNFVANYKTYTTPDIWLGITINSATQKFETMDNFAINYVNWAPGQPGDIIDADQCLSVTSGATPEWSGQTCTDIKDFVCAFPTIDEPVADGNCKEGWFKFIDKCYRIFPERSTFYEASFTCSQEIGGSLAAVSNSLLQGLLTYMMKPEDNSEPEDVWIGLWDYTNEGTFRWANNELFDPDTSFSNWAPGQPDGFIFNDAAGEADCVKMIAHPINSGQWDDTGCLETYQFLCESYMDATLPTQSPPVSASCTSPYIPASGSCFRVSYNTSTYEEAQLDCVESGSNLASIEDGYLQGFLQFLVGSEDPDVPTTAWIGFSDGNSTGEYRWMDDYPVTYTNWDVDGGPTGGTCAQISTDGRWVSADCQATANFICEFNEANYVPPIPPVTYCEDDWVMRDQKCYLFDTYDRPDGDLVDVFYSFSEAKQDCTSRDAGAGLASLHSVEDNEWFYNGARFLLGNRKIWIGLHRQSAGVLTWDDESPVDYVNWAPGQPIYSGRGTDCVTYYADNEGLGQWSVSNCFELNAHVCMKEPLPGGRPLCDPGWDFSLIGTTDCYYTSTAADGMLSWHEAQAVCFGMDSNLLSIFSDGEERFIVPLAEERFGSSVGSWPWIGFRRNYTGDNFVWTDESPVDFTRWGNEQPDGLDDDCTVIQLDGSGAWNNVNCGLKRPFICKKPFDSTGPATIAPTPVPSGGCGDSEALLLGSKCYVLVTEPLDWDSARERCATDRDNGELASISGYDVQVLISSLLMYVDSTSIWNGMTSRAPDSFPEEYHWIDGSTVNYYNWGSGQPGPATTEGRCVRMLNDAVTPGQWYSELCENQYPSCCQYDPDPVAPEPTLGPTACPAGYRGFPSACFMIETVRQDHAGAVAACEANGGILAPIENGYEDAFVELLMAEAGVTSVWIGLRSDEESNGKYGWTTPNWPVMYLNWDDGQPSAATGCGTSYYQSGWRTTNCVNLNEYVCRSAADTPPIVPTDPAVDCPDSWYTYEGKCYLFQTDFEDDNILNTFAKCYSISGIPSSIHSLAENSYINNRVIEDRGGGIVWIGLNLQDGTYVWMDGTMVDYVNWDPSYYPTDGMDCVVMNTALDGRWEVKTCTEMAGVICQSSDIKYTPAPPTTSEEPTVTPAASLSNGALIGIIVGGSVGLLLVLILLCYCCRDDEKADMYYPEEQQPTDKVTLTEDIELRKRAAQKEKDMESSSSSSSSEDGDSM